MAFRPLAVAGLGGLLALLSFGSAGSATDALPRVPASVDDLPPVLTLPAPLTVPATRLDGAFVSYLAVATDDVAPTALECAPASGSLFAVGVNQVDCRATDAGGNVATGSFSITVLSASAQISLLIETTEEFDLARGTAISLLAKLEAAEAAAGRGQPKTACNIVRAFTQEVRARTGASISSAAASVLLDSAEMIRAALGCASSASAPVLARPRDDISTVTAPNQPTAMVLYTDRSSGPVSTSCAPPSGSAFPLGRTTVACVARDAAGRSADATFDVTVVDGEPPVLSLPDDMTVQAPPGAATAVVAFTPTATDNVQLVDLTCDPPSGSTFPLGTTTVECIAMDTSGNRATGSFTVTVVLAISGRVTDRDTGLPIAGLRVAVLESPTFAVLAVAHTDADGRYSIVVAPGTYRVPFNFDRALPYVPETWDRKPFVREGDDIVVAASVGGIDAALASGRFIRGRVIDEATRAPLAEIGAAAYDAGTLCCTRIAGAGTNPSGEYTLIVPTGSRVKVTFSGPPGSRHLREWWNDRRSFEEADILEMTMDRSDIDAALASGFFISGQVRDEGSGLAIAGADVNANDASGPCCRSLDGMRTDANGEYALLVPSGSTVKVQFATFNPPPGAPAYLQEWWNDRPSFEAADPLVMAMDHSDIDAELTRARTIRGRVIDEATGAPLAGIFVGAQDATALCCSHLAGTGTTPSGEYVLTVPAESRIKVIFTGPPGSRHLREWWNDRRSFEEADILEMTMDRSDIDAALASGFVIRGRVLDDGTGLPVEGADVNANDASGPCCRSLDGMRTDANGEYALLVPSGSTVKVQFATFNPPPDAPVYVEEWWNDRRGFDEADVLQVTADRANVDARLTRGFAIRGRVTEEGTGAPLAGIGVGANDATAPFCCSQLGGGAGTNTNGEYTLILPAGSRVKLFFNGPPGSVYLGEFWDDKTSYETADLLEVTADRSGVDVALRRGFLVSGRVTDAEHPDVGVPDVDVIAQCCFGARTASDGTYVLAVPAGTYRISFFPQATSGFLPQHWDGKLTFTDADLLTVPSDTVDLSAINARLERGVPLTGTVTIAATRAPIEHVGVVATLVDDSIGCCLNLSGATGPDGRYSIFVRRGDYKVSFQPRVDTGLLQEFWNDKRDFGSADVVSVTGGTANIDAALEQGFRVSGRVTLASDPTRGVERVGVTIQQPVCCGFFTVQLTAADGTYAFIVPAGTYKIGFFPPAESGLSIEFWNDRATFSSADELVVSADVASIDAALEPALRLTGHITSASGAGIGGAQVSLFTTSCESVQGTTTAPDGGYSIFVRAGVYKIAFFGPFGGEFRSEFFDDQPDCASADPVEFTEDRVLDVSLSALLRISGRVTNEAGEPIAGVIANIVLADAPPCCRFVFGATTDADGRYSAPVDPGTYKVLFFPGLDVPYLMEWWDDQPNIDAADTVTVTSTPVARIDAVLRRAVLVSGRVTASATGGPVRGASVILYDAGAPCCSSVDGRGTNPDGRFSFAVPPGDYKISVFPPEGSGLSPEWWDDRPSFETAHVLSGADDHLGIHVALEPAGAPGVAVTPDAPATTTTNGQRVYDVVAADPSGSPFTGTIDVAFAGPADAMFSWYDAEGTVTDTAVRCDVPAFAVAVAGARHIEIPLGPDGRARFAVCSLVATVGAPVAWIDGPGGVQNVRDAGEPSDAGGATTFELPVLSGMAVLPGSSTRPTTADATSAAVSDQSLGEGSFSATLVDQAGLAFSWVGATPLAVDFAVANDGDGTVWLVRCGGLALTVAIGPGETNATCEGGILAGQTSVAIQIDSADAGVARVVASAAAGDLVLSAGATQVWVEAFGEPACGPGSIVTGLAVFVGQTVSGGHYMVATTVGHFVISWGSAEVPLVRERFIVETTVASQEDFGRRLDIGDHVQWSCDFLDEEIHHITADH